MKKMGNNSDLVPGTIHRFRHIHTNEVTHIKKLHKIEKGKVLLELRIKSKNRRMLILWEEKGVYTVLYMTGKKRAFFGKRVDNDKDSFVDCSRYYEYNQELIIPEKSLGKINDKVWKKVLKELPRSMSDSITRIEGRMGYEAPGRNV